ncbi:hypothetical protein VTK73DRAFT_2253 [Phialemonium thermophilum]|uniref:HCNGP-like protein n=1 Tax=Phialemonium thermophilum TaxID=223376 RepID=A0ABR3X5V2_9PEZI
MTGLVSYESSDEEDVEEKTLPPKTEPSTTDEAVGSRLNAPQKNVGTGSHSEADILARKPETLTTELAPKPTLGPLMGPAIGPSLPPPSPSAGSSPFPNSSSTMPPLLPEPDPDEPPRSPTSANRALLRDLTLPAVPNTDIPPSPPASPRPPGLDALNTKLLTFLEMKRRSSSEGGAVHFNARLASSTALRNPALMDKLLGFIGIDTEFGSSAVDERDGGRRAGTSNGGGGGGTAIACGPVRQYATTLSTELWDPAAFPPWAFRRALRRAQERVVRERERGKGEPVEFVPAGGGGSRGGTPGMSTISAPPPQPATGKRKTRFDA